MRASENLARSGLLSSTVVLLMDLSAFVLKMLTTADRSLAPPSLLPISLLICQVSLASFAWHLDDYMSTFDSTCCFSASHTCTSSSK